MFCVWWARPFSETVPAQAAAEFQVWVWLAVLDRFFCIRIEGFHMRGKHICSGYVHTKDRYEP